MRGRWPPGTVFRMRLLAALLGLLLLAPAASAATPVYKVSAYGVQRTTTTSSTTATGRCFDERGSESSEVVVRFKTPRAMRARLLTIGPTATLIPADHRDLMLSGTIERKVSGALEHASCADLNPDGSPKWVPKELPEGCSRSFDDYTASLRFDGRRLEFNAQQPLLASLVCVNEDIASVKKRVSARQALESDGAPIRIQTSSRSTTAAPDGSYTSTTTRLTTVYIQFRKIG
jgi:hypothetical protein